VRRWWHWRQEFVKYPLNELVQEENRVGDEVLEEVSEPHDEQLQRTQSENGLALCGSGADRSLRPDGFACDVMLSCGSGQEPPGKGSRHRHVKIRRCSSPSLYHID
jgi:hypothetical protein